MVLGALLIVGAIALAYWNQKEEETAQEAVTQIVPQLVQQIQENTAAEEVTSEETIPEPEMQIPVELLTEEDKQMPEMEINGYRYIGFLSIPDLKLELPIMSTWNYRKLKIAPCRYTGSVRGEDLVLMAHNYKSHFGKLSRLDLGDNVYFTDMDGQTTCYEVVGTDVLAPTAVAEVVSGEFDLTLFTCTYGGKSRVTVYCNQVEE